LRRLALVGLGLLFVLAGMNHFRDPAFYHRIMPTWLPAPGALIALSGAVEIALGILVFPSVTREATGWALIGLLVLFLSVHIDMIAQPGRFAAVPSWILWLRLPMQVCLMYWAWWATRVVDGTP
jgi:uncharacterized membrane protein